MVVFTCNNCGDSLQKPKVEKHYATACRGAKNLTCVDCLKDFRGEEYGAHTKCITEQERYSAKGSVTNVVGKGEAKQQQWSDMINAIIQNTKPTGAQKFIFQIISNQTQNVPRKKIKFINFIKSSAGNKVQNPDIEAVWDLIEKHKADAPASVNAVDSTTTEPPKESQIDTVEDSSSKKKKKKSNHSESDTVSNTISPKDDGSVGKKKKKRKSENINVAPVTPTNLPVNGSEEISLQDDGGEKKKKKKRKSENVSIAPITTTNGGNLLINGNEEISLQGDGSEAKKKKKRKSENLNTTITATNGHDNPPINETEEKTKKRKSDTVISEVNGSDVHADTNFEKNKKKVTESSLQESSKPTDSISKKKKKQNQEITEVEAKKANDSISKEKKKGKPQPGGEGATGPAAVASANEPNFNGNDNSLNDSFIRITLKKLQKKNSLSLDKLQKKVLAEYCKESNVTESPKLVKQFKKKLKKMKGVEIVDDTVRLKTLDAC